VPGNAPGIVGQRVCGIGVGELRCRRTPGVVAGSSASWSFPSGHVLALSSGWQSGEPLLGGERCFRNSPRSLEMQWGSSGRRTRVVTVSGNAVCSHRDRFSRQVFAGHCSMLRSWLVAHEEVRLLSEVWSGSFSTTSFGSGPSAEWLRDR
jgi:hypothetical protein